jgi:outer membrane receptor protein involved in Fe transport
MLKYTPLGIWLRLFALGGRVRVIPESTRSARHRFRDFKLAWTVALVGPAAVLAQEAPETAAGQLSEVVVTAQKREESADAVGMSISAISGDTLLQRGVTSVTDLGLPR